MAEKKRISAELERGTLLISFTITIVCIALTGFALVYHNQNATSGYQLKQLQTERSEVLFEIETLEMEIADLGALE